MSWLRFVRTSRPRVHVESSAIDWSSLSDAVLAERFASLREAPAFDAAWRATAAEGVAEAVRRTTGLSYYAVQRVGGLAIASGAIAEMATGEGKTLTAAIPAALAALQFGSVHVMTPNAYLAERDFAELHEVYTLLGLSAAHLPEGHEAEGEKRAAYRCEVVYGTGYEFGFDFLKDELARRSWQPPALGEQTARRLAGRQLSVPPVPLQPERAAALVDEADSVLLDEATTPLVLSGLGVAAAGEERAYAIAREAAESLVEGVDYRLRPDGRSPELAGERRRTRVPVAGLPLRRPWWQYLEHALHARHIFRRNVDYVVAGDAVKIVDEQTGRVFEDRSWRAGLHQAVESLEGVTISPERTTTARITRQRLMRQYRFLGGMTGTAQAAAREFAAVYRCPVVAIERRLPCRRRLRATRYFASTEQKQRAIAAEVVAMRDRGRPVLVGCRTIATAAAIAACLEDAGVEVVVLDGVQDADEAAVVAEAGRSGRVTVATNMAGRGTDIKPDREALEAGGLHVIATERHRSARVDGQLVGRAARQGQPGSARFFVASDDDLFAEELSLAAAVARHGRRSPESTDLDRRVARLQTQCEREDARRRAESLRRDAWMEDVLQACAG